jgi:hypothetical protein
MPKIRLIWNELRERFRLSGFLSFGFSFGSANLADPVPFVPLGGFRTVGMIIPTACSSREHHLRAFLAQGAPAVKSQERRLP